MKKDICICSSLWRLSFPVPLFLELVAERAGVAEGARTNAPLGVAEIAEMFKEAEIKERTKVSEVARAQEGANVANGATVVEVA